MYVCMAQVCSDIIQLLPASLGGAAHSDHPQDIIAVHLYQLERCSTSTLDNIRLLLCVAVLSGCWQVPHGPRVVLGVHGVVLGPTRCLLRVSGGEIADKRLAHQSCFDVRPLMDHRGHCDTSQYVLPLCRDYQVGCLSHLYLCVYIYIYQCVIYVCMYVCTYGFKVQYSKEVLFHKRFSLLNIYIHSNICLRNGIYVCSINFWKFT